MSKLICYFFIFCLLSLIFNPTDTLALEICGKGGTPAGNPTWIPENQSNQPFTFTRVAPGTYSLRFGCSRNPLGQGLWAAGLANNNSVTITANNDCDYLILQNDGQKNVTLVKCNQSYYDSCDINKLDYWNDVCSFSYKIGYAANDCRITVSPITAKTGDIFYVNITNAPMPKKTAGNPDQKTFLAVKIQDTTSTTYKDIYSIKVAPDGKGEILPVGPFDRPGTYSFYLRSWEVKNSGETGAFCYSPPFKLEYNTSPGITQPPPASAPNPSGGAPTPPSTPPPGGAGAVCNTINGATPTPGQSVTAFTTSVGSSNVGILTAIGCIPTEPTQFILAVSRLATGMGGGIALLLIIAGAFKMITSAGNPDHVKEGSEQMTSAIIGLLFIIFAVLLLKVIGVDILDLPDFGPP